MNLHDANLVELAEPIEIFEDEDLELDPLTENAEWKKAQHIKFCQESLRGKMCCCFLPLRTGVFIICVFSCIISMAVFLISFTPATAIAPASFDSVLNFGKRPLPSQPPQKTTKKTRDPFFSTLHTVNSFIIIHVTKC